MDLVIGLIIVTIVGVVGVAIAREGVRVIAGRVESRFSRPVTTVFGLWYFVFGSGLAVFALVTLSRELI